jgi:hypothetical protein
MQDERMATLEELRAAWLWANWLRQIENYNKHNTAQILGFEEEVA